MIIDLATINFAGGGSGGGGTPTPTVKLQEKTVGITTNGTTVIVPDAGYGGMYEVEVNVDVPTQGGGGTPQGTYVTLDTTGVTNMANYFENLPVTAYNIDFTGITNTQSAFSRTLVDDIDEVNLPDVTNARLMFAYCKQLTKAPKIIAPKLENASYMFYDAYNITSSPDIDLPAVTDLSNCFSPTGGNVPLLTQFPNINAPELKNAESLFSSCKSAVGFPTINAPKLENARGMFNGCEGITSVPDLYFPELTNAQAMFMLCTGVTSFGTLSFPKVTNTAYMFSNSKATSIPYFDTSNVTTMKQMFQYCQYITSVAEYNTSNVTDMSQMFYYCTKLETVPQFDTSNVTTMNQMFQSCTNLSSVPHFNTSNVKDMTQMLERTAVTTIPQFDTSRVTTVYRMLYSLGNGILVSLPLLDFGNVTNINMFLGTGQNALTDLGGFKDLKIDWKDNYGLASCPNLTYQSVMNVINNLYDFRANGDNTTTKTLKLNANSLALLSDADKAIATNKGWILS